MDARIDATNLTPPRTLSHTDKLAAANNRTVAGDKLDLPREQSLANTDGVTGQSSLKVTAKHSDQATKPEIDKMAQALIRILDGEVEDLEGQSTLAKLNEIMRDRDRDLEFLIDDSTGKNVLKVLHSQSQEVIRQFPSEEVLRVAQFIVEGNPGLVDDLA